jgi:hypothetical protein
MKHANGDGTDASVFEGQRVIIAHDDNEIGFIPNAVLMSISETESRDYHAQNVIW